MPAINRLALRMRGAHSMRLTAGGVAAAVVLGGLTLAPPARAVGINDGVPGQVEVDGETFGNGYAGGWGSLPGGVEARPVVRSLIVANGDALRTVIDNPEGVPVPEASDGLDVVITPVNLCRPDQEPSQPGQPITGPTCYATPNRISISVGYTDGEQLRTNFSDPSAAGLVIGEDTHFELTVDLNTLGQSLRWTWLQGEPIYWRTTNLGQEDATLKVRFKPRKTPIAFNEGGGQVGCSAIPVSPTCDFPEAQEYRLQANLVLSLDETLDPAFTGSLFATENAYIGSLEASNTQTGPQMTWGIAAPVTVDGDANRSRLWAVVPDAALLNYFGLPPEADPSVVLGGTIDSASARPRLTWEPWSSDLQGTDGWLVQTSALAVDQTEADSGGQSLRAADARARAGALVAEAVTINVRRNAAAPQVRARQAKVGKPTGVSFTGTAAHARACRAATCRVVISRVPSAVAARAPQLATASAVPSRATLSVDRAVTGLKRGQRVVVVLQKRSGTTGPWTYVASGITSVTS